ncbi:MAG: class I SAM-dependent RNA methyltransferase [Hyphomicrobiales bacterium]|nr:class I SAM-dependent RNA methyltransferase [Hyphomicrobiales bacterium]
MGARADGKLLGHEGLHLPFVLPGEEVMAREDAGGLRLVSIERASPDRIPPICPYFGVCGGCKLQHWRLGPYLSWKRELVVEALATQGIEVSPGPIIDAHGEGRRRVSFHARRFGREVRTGFMQAASHDLVEIEVCPILAPGLADAPRIASRLAAILTRSGKPLDIAVSESRSGLDVMVKGRGPWTAAERDEAIALAASEDLARLSNHHEVIVERRPPLVAIGDCQVLPPPGAFLQATARGEAILTELVGKALAGARRAPRRIADLFCGIGPFALRFALAAQVRAFDGDARALAALLKAARRTQGLKPLEAQARDLFRRPLLATELAEFDAVILDPPRQGAQAQTQELARSKVARIVYVSCNPSTFARDARILIEGGYLIDTLTPVDQFRFSAHVELVAAFRRPDGRPR